MIAMVVAAAIVTSCGVTDGDTIRCGDERIRLLGIDAPEMAGHCRRGRTCAPGDPIASSRRLAGAMRPQMRIERVSTDRYGRTIALVYVDGRSLSCAQLGARAAIYVGKWDDGGRVAAECPRLAR